MTRRCKKCYGHRTKRNFRGVPGTPQTHHKTGTRHLCVPNWTNEGGWGFWSLCGVPVVFWRPEDHLQHGDRVELGPQALGKWPELSDYQSWRVVQVSYHADREPAELVTAKGLAPGPTDGLGGYPARMGMCDVEGPPHWFRRIDPESEGH